MITYLIIGALFLDYFFVFIALFAKEKSYSFLRSHLKNTLISTVSLVDVYKYCIEEQNLTKDDCRKLTEISGLKVIDFCNEQALISAYIINQTKPYGLSLDDRACLALALYKKNPIVTCDKIFEKFELNIEFLIARQEGISHSDSKDESL